MSLVRIRMQLEKWELAMEDDELGIGVMPVGPYLFFGDSSGRQSVVVSEDYASRCLNQIAFRMGKLTREEFWSGKWLGELMRYKSLEKLWVGIRAEPSNVSVAVPRTTETVGIGRAKRISPGLVAFRVRERRVRACGHKGYGEVDTGLKNFRNTSGIGLYYREKPGIKDWCRAFPLGQFSRRS